MGGDDGWGGPGGNEAVRDRHEEEEEEEEKVTAALKALHPAVLRYVDEHQLFERSVVRVPRKGILLFTPSCREHDIRHTRFIALNAVERTSPTATSLAFHDHDTRFFTVPCRPLISDYF